MSKRTLWLGWLITSIAALVEMASGTETLFAAMVAAAVVLGWLAASTPPKN